MQGRRAANKYFPHNVINWRRKRQPTLGLFPEKSQRQRSLAGYSPRGRKESHRTQQVKRHHHCEQRREGRDKSKCQKCELVLRATSVLQKSRVTSFTKFPTASSKRHLPARHLGKQDLISKFLFYQSGVGKKKFSREMKEFLRKLA